MQQGMREMTDRQLLQSYADGRNVQAFDVFVDRHENALLSFAASFLRDEGQAQDVVQETFFRVARYPKRILSATGAGAVERNWLLKVVRDLSIDNLRRRAVERKAASLLRAAAAAAGQVAPSAEEGAERGERSAQVRAAIERLTPRLRELMILKVREQKSYKEIAQITGLSVTNVGFVLYQAMQALEKELTAQDAG